jgi:hypothetical protein
MFGNLIQGTLFLITLTKEVECSSATTADESVDGVSN